MQDEDAGIVQAALCGSKDAFATLWDRYGAEAERWAFAATGDLVDAEEVAQEAFSEALDRLSGLREPARFGGWLRRIVRNRAVDLIRRRQRSVTIDSYNLTDDVRAPIEARSWYEAPQPDAVFERTDSQHRLSSALETLPQRYAKIVRMFYFEDQSQESIARRLGTTVPAVKGALFRARVILKEELRRHER